MRTTLTLDDDLAELLAEEARRRGIPFKAVVNETLRRGMASVASAAARPVVRTRPQALGFRPGIDLDRLNQLVDDLEAEAFRGTGAGGT